MDMDEVDKYYGEHSKNIEHTLSEAVDNCITVMPPEPIKYIGKDLLEKEGVDTRGLELDPERPDDRTMDIKGMLVPVLEAVRSRRASALGGTQARFCGGGLAISNASNFCFFLFQAR